VPATDWERERERERERVPGTGSATGQALAPGWEMVQETALGSAAEPAAFRPLDRQKRNRFHFRCRRKRQRRR